MIAPQLENALLDAGLPLPLQLVPAPGLSRAARGSLAAQASQLGAAGLARAQSDPLTQVARAAGGWGHDVQANCGRFARQISELGAFGDLLRWPWLLVL